MPDESLQGKGRWVRQIAVSLDELQWERLRQAAEAETGMELSGTRFPRLQEAVTNVLDRQQSATPLEVILADSRQRSTFLERLCAELTIGESFFLRNEHHFRALREQVLPGTIKQNESSRTIRIWSAGCATGEEPYSLAILLDELLPDPDQWNVHILATDLNPEFLETAREARYRKWSFRGTNICNNRNYFKPEGALFRLDPRLRRRVRFSYLNLVKDVYPSPMTRSKRFTRRGGNRGTRKCPSTSCSKYRSSRVMRGTIRSSVATTGGGGRCNSTGLDSR